MGLRVFCGAAIAGLLAASPSVAKDKKMPKQLRQLVAMTPEDHLRQVSVDDDNMEVVATFDTSKSFQEKRGLLKIVWNDIFLRGFVDKQSGKTQYQVYFQFRGASRGWPRLNTANYQTAEGLKSAELRQIGSDVDCTASRYVGCTYTEVVTFPVEEELLRAIADEYAPDQAVAWKIRFKGQSGIDVDEGLMAAEISGLLTAVDRYRAQNGLYAEEVASEREEQGQ